MRTRSEFFARQSGRVAAVMVAVAFAAGCGRLTAEYFVPEPYSCAVDPGALLPRTEAGSRKAWYGAHFSAAGESSLCLIAGAADPGAEMYRFAWLRSFHEPIFIRVELRGDTTGVMHIKVLDGAGGYDPGVILVDSVIVLGARQVHQIRHRVTGMALWSSVTRIPEPDRSGLDGARWIVESVRSGEYRSTDRWTPENSNPVRRFGIELLTIGGVLPQDRDLIY